MRGVGQAQVGASPPVGVRGGGVVEGGAAFAVGLVDACPSSHQCDRALVAAVGGCVVQWSPGEKGKRRDGRIRGRSKRAQMRSQELLSHSPYSVSSSQPSLYHVSLIRPPLGTPVHINTPSKFVSPPQVSSTAQQQIKTFNIPKRKKDEG